MRASEPDAAAASENVDVETVAGFGDEWSRFRQREWHGELQVHFEQYFSEFPWDTLPAAAVGADFGCGSGRWARFVAPRVGTLHALDASADALQVARENLAEQANVQFHHAPIDRHPLPDGSLDFAYCLGVLHHVPDTESALAACARALRPGAPFLVYMYYALENRPLWYRALFRASHLARQGIARCPPRAKNLLTDAIAGGIYWPLARAARAVEQLGGDGDAMPLGYYREVPFYTMRTDARDRFGTRLEKRYTKEQLAQMMRAVGMDDLRFREGMPYWCVVGRKRG